MNQQIVIKGLCRSCAKAAKCEYLLKTVLPVFQCEEFEGFKSRRKKKIGLKRPKQSVNQNCKIKGLCRTCSKFDNCLYPKPETGVWFCDEYE